MSDFRPYVPLLYVPGNRPGLERLITGSRSVRDRTVAICFEDAVRPDERGAALTSLAKWLHRLSGTRSCFYIRPADGEMLVRLLSFSGIEMVEGFLVPKVTPAKLQHWANLTGPSYAMLPILETREALDACGRHELAAACASVRERIPRVRIGANDLLALLGGLRRPRGKTIYETPLGRVIDELIEIFSGVDLPLAGCVFDRLDDSQTLLRECRDDVARGLFAKAALNPTQAKTIFQSYLPSLGEIEEARSILLADAPAVYAMNGSMLEPACHAHWARELLSRAVALGGGVASVPPATATPSAKLNSCVQ